MDLVCLQEGFSSLIKNADPQHLGPFFVWLDFKVAQFKINGTFSPEKNKAGIEKVTKNLFDNDGITTSAISSTIMFPGTTPLETEKTTSNYLTTPIRDNKAYMNHLYKSLSFSDSKLSLYQLNWDALDPRLGYRNNLTSSLAQIRGGLFPQMFPETLTEPIDFSKSDKKKFQNVKNEDYSNLMASEASQSIPKPKEVIRSLLREVLSRPRDMPLSSTPIKTPPQNKDEKVEDKPSDVLVVLPEDPNAPPNETQKETRHTCTICQKEFNYKSSYRRHMKIHQGLYSHTCCICTRKFTRKEHFVRHKCDRRPNKPNRRSAILDISMNSEPDSSSLVRMDELEIDSPFKVSMKGSPQTTAVKADSSSFSQGAARQLFSDYKTTKEGENDGQIREEYKPVMISPLISHDDDPNKNLESRRKSSTPRKFVAHSSSGQSDNEDSAGQFQKSENDSESTVQSEMTMNLEPEMKIIMPNVQGPQMPLEIRSTGERHLDLQTGSYVVSTGLVTDREEALAIKIKKQAKYLKLKNEAKMVDGTLRFECPQCSKVFYRSSNFSRHMRIHRGIYSYVCQACKRGFFRKEHFQKHKCHRRGQDFHLDVMNGRNLMPFTTDAAGSLNLFSNINKIDSSDTCKNSTGNAHILPYLGLYQNEDSNNLIRCVL